jgi:hypothetical protein
MPPAIRKPARAGAERRGRRHFVKKLFPAAAKKTAPLKEIFTMNRLDHCLRAWGAGKLLQVRCLKNLEIQRYNPHFRTRKLLAIGERDHRPAIDRVAAGVLSSIMEAKPQAVDMSALC